MTTDTRVFFRDVKPYDIVDDLDELAGPTTGTVALPIFMYWAPGRNTFDLTIHDDLVRVYTCALTEGRIEDQRTFMNAATLRRLWPEIRLPERVRTLWETRFPTLTKAQ